MANSFRYSALVRGVDFPNGEVNTHTSLPVRRQFPTISTNAQEQTAGNHDDNGLADSKYPLTLKFSLYNNTLHSEVHQAEQQVKCLSNSPFQLTHLNYNDSSKTFLS
jgi:hypothetical protein